MIEECNKPARKGATMSRFRYCLKELGSMQKLYGRSKIASVAEYADLHTYAIASASPCSGVKPTLDLDPWTPVLFDWRRQMPSHTENVLFTTAGVFQAMPVQIVGERGSISVFVLRKISRKELLAYARACPGVIGFVSDRLDTLLFRIGRQHLI